MRVSHLLPTLIAANAVLAAPGVHLPASPGELAAQAFDSASSWVQKTLAEAKHGFEHLENGIEGIKTEMVEVHGIECESDRASKESCLIRRRSVPSTPILPVAPIASGQA